MSKRRGDFITLDELLDEIGVDATRFFMLQRSHDRTVDLDLELARRESPENPVYYVQYAHARIVSMLGRLEASAGAAALAPGAGWGDGELEDAERDLIKALVAFPRRDRRGGRAPGAAPDRRLRAGARPGVHRVLPGLQGGGCEPESRRVLPDRAVAVIAADDQAGARAARSQRAGLDVALAAANGRRPGGPVRSRARSSSSRRASAGASAGRGRLGRLRRAAPGAGAGATGGS